MPSAQPRPAPAAAVEPAAPRRTDALVLVVLAAAVVARVVFWLGAFPNSDEAYYWLWGRHPSLSYYDHAPLHAWVQGLFAAAFGRSLFALRLPTLLTTAGSLAILVKLTAALRPGAARACALTVAAAFLASPLFVMFASFAWHDHLLVFFTLLAGWLWLGFLTDVARGGRGGTGRLALAALALGLAGLSKYNAVFLGLGIAATLVADRRLRRLWRDPRLYAAAALALLVVSPVVVWNAGHGGASFRYNLVERNLDHGALRLNLRGTLNLVLYSVFSLSPFLVWAVAAELRRRRRDPSAPEPLGSVHRRLALVTFALPTLFFLALSTFSLVLYYWLIVGYLLLLPLAAGLVDRPRLLRAHLVYGLVASALMTFHAAVLPVSALSPRIQDDDSKMMWGWDAVAAAVRRERATAPAGFLAASDYRSAAALAFALDDPDVKALSQRHSQFDFWLDAPAHAGQSALVLTDAWHPMTPWLRGRFRAVQRVAIVPITRLGFHVKDYELWRGEGFEGG
ncbi:MAG TPA: glycosyltransferase family 39 protein [Anaeromyxobacteraceae bacterium]